MATLNNLSGKTIGRLKVLRRIIRPGKKETFWLCKCNCTKGTEIVVSAHRLRTARTTSCGCLRDDVLAGIAARRALSLEKKERKYVLYARDQVMIPFLTLGAL